MKRSIFIAFIILAAVVGWRVGSHRLEMDELSKFLRGVRSILSDLEHFFVGVVGLRIEVDRVGFLIEEWNGTEDVHLVVFVKVEKDGLFVVLLVGEHFVSILNLIL